MDGRTKGFSSITLAKASHCLCWLAFFPQCILVPCAPQVSDAHTPSRSHDVKENMIHQTRPPSSIAPLYSFDAHVPTVGTFGGGQRSAGAPWLACSYAAPYATNCMHCVFWHLSVRTSINFFRATVAHLLDRTTRASLRSPHASVSLGHPWSVAGSPLFLPWTTFDRYWPLQTENTPQELQFWRCSDPVVQPSQFGPCQTRSNPYTCLFFLLPTHQLWGQHVHLLPNMPHPLTGAMMKKLSVLFTSPVVVIMLYLIGVRQLKFEYVTTPVNMSAWVT